jgi:hypothetical protein
MEAKAELLYKAVMATLQETGMMGLLAAAGDAKEKVGWENASAKTREIFRKLGANLTALEPKA